MTSNRAALYLRSSKDRKEVSLDAQRAELESLASKHGLEIVATFEDAVQSGQTDDRPGFQELNVAVRSRKLDAVLVYDTSRIARNRLVAQVFKRECERYGVRILYVALPSDLDPITELLLNAVYEAFDQMHSMTSRQKGLAGMRQNVAKGWRAGGRAPLGYRLRHEPTGAIRDGKPVLKSRLALDNDSELVRQYLRARAARESRAALIARLHLRWPASSLVCVEWNALAYAGHTVWNRHREKIKRGTGQTRRRPRAEWLVQRNTHQALITDVEAESILAQLTTSKVSEAIRQARVSKSNYLLSGLLQTADGRPWLGCAGKSYRLKPHAGQRGRHVPLPAIEQAVLEQLRNDMGNERFVTDLVAATRNWYPDHDPAQALDCEAQRLTKEAEKAARLALETSEPAPLLMLMETKRQQADAVRRQAEAVRADDEITSTVRRITPDAIRALLGEPGVPEAALRTLVAKIVLEPDLSCRIDYHVATGVLGVASPGGFEPPSPP